MAKLRESVPFSSIKASDAPRVHRTHGIAALDEAMKRLTAVHEVNAMRMMSRGRLVNDFNLYNHNPETERTLKALAELINEYAEKLSQAQEPKQVGWGY